MRDLNDTAVNRREFIQGALSLSAFSVLPVPSFAADDAGLQNVLAHVPKLHDQTVKALQSWGRSKHAYVINGTLY